MDPSHAPQYSPADIERIAIQLLTKTYPEEIKIPVGIDFIAESNSLINDIIPNDDLESDFDVCAVIVRLPGTGLIDIHIDDLTFCTNKGRANFSIAHELGHVILHHEIWEQCFTVKDSIAMNGRIQKCYGTLEAQANKFASNILMPRRRLIDDTCLVYHSLVKKFGFDDVSVIQNHLGSILALRYEVSRDAMSYRLENCNLIPAVINAHRDKAAYLDEYLL